MKTIKFSFKSQNKVVKRTAILTDDLQDMSRNKKNQCYDTLDDGIEDGYWSLIFEGEQGENVFYEIEMAFDKRNYERTLTPIKALTWADTDNDVLLDSQEVSVNVK